MTESGVLRLSVLVSLLVGAVGVAWGVLADSRVVLFDGLFTIFGTALSGISLFAAWAAGLEPDRRYPFGREAVIPVAILLQGAALGGTLVYAAIDSFSLLLAGGTDATPASVIGYGVVTLVVALVMTFALRRLAPRSELAAAEADQWRAGTVLSAIIAVGAAAAAGAAALGWHHVVPYADPVLVLVAVAVLAPVPWRLVRTAGREILEAAPPPSVQDRIDTAAARASAEFGLGEPIVRATKLGRRLYVEVDFVVGAGEWDVADEDRVRRMLIGDLEPIGYEVWANVELTTDPTLAT
ncbi:MAG: cation transporter [Propionicimonas sp.]|uniref:cation transporter n=1 Tax=Propionicimonas sp. TaxID=1955623 RepID=UPI003D1148B3